ncbi:MAG: C10 family peptidase [Bacteroidetes bacterium]|nr:C10 family peptidase [Bacteroidota bacterium]
MQNRLLLLSALTFLMVPCMLKGQGASGRVAHQAAVGVREQLPMLSTKWAQGCLYNAACPIDTASHTTCLHVPAGTAAVAMAQLMKFYQYPAHGTGEHGYAHPKYGIQYANFGATNFNWSAMPDSLTTGSDGLATLVYLCGVAQNMNYGTTGASSVPEDVDSAFVKYFGYPDGASWKLKGHYTKPEWRAMLKTELDASHPVLTVAYDNTAQHQRYFICDGYKNDSLFHISWGEGGAGDGYYWLDSLFYNSINYSIIQRALFDLAPVPPGPASYIMNFENVPDFSLAFNDWTVNDVDRHDTYGITNFSFSHQTEPMAFLSFNPAQVTPTMASDQAIQPHGGLRFGACFSSNPPSNNDWFISPQIQLGTDGSFSFWIKSYTDLYGLDNYTVAVSTTDNNPGSFTVISGTQPLQTTTSWAKRTFNLSGYNNRKVYVAINCVSTDHFLMMIDDLEVKPQSSSVLTADFTSDKISLRVGEKVSFTDQSSGLPAAWAWKFTGGTPSTSVLQNPADIQYNTPGSYAVSLKVSNGTASDSVTKTAYITVNGYPAFMSLDFESPDDFTMAFNPWTVNDVNGGETYGIKSVTFLHNYLPMAYICFNPEKTTPPLDSTNMHAHGGQKLGCSFSSVPPNNPNDKWLISPKMSLGLNPQVELWVKTYNDQFAGKERYNIAVSTTELTPSSFTPLTAQPESAPTVWTRKTYSLANYTNQDVYIGIQCVTNDGFIFMIDDISITSSLGTGATNSLERLVIFPNPAKDHLMINCPASSNLPYTIEMINVLGEKIASWSEVPVSGRITLGIQQIPRGIYLVRVASGAEEVIRKISIIN